MGINESVFLAAVDTMYAGILGLAFILLIVFCVVARKTWSWIDITFVILSFIAGLSAIWGLTQVYDLRTTALKEVDKWEKQLEKNLREADLVIIGDPTSLSYDPGSLRALDGELVREMTGRGRVWGGGTITADNANRVFKFASPRVDVAERPLQNVVVQAFLERPLTVNGQNYPAVYIGSVRVESESADSLTLSPVALAEPAQFATPNGSWALFEKMPQDRRGIFKAATIELAAMNSNAPADLVDLAANLKDDTADLNITPFRKMLESNFLRADQLGMNPNSREYEALIDRYAFDGLSFGKIKNWIESTTDRKSTTFEPPPEEEFVLYRFTAKSSKPYPVDADGSVETDGLFTPLGLAIDKGLHAGKEIAFEMGDTILVDKLTADGYQRGDNTIDGFSTVEKDSIEEVDRYYIRQVRDFPYEFSDLREQAAKMAIEIAVVNKNNLIQDKAYADAIAQRTVRDTTKADLTSDQTYLGNDLATIIAHREKMSAESAQLQAKIASLERKIDAEYKRLRTLSLDMSRRAFAGR